METGCCPPPVVAPSLSIYGRVEGNNRYALAPGTIFLCRLIKLLKGMPKTLPQVLVLG